MSRGKATSTHYSAALKEAMAKHRMTATALASQIGMDLSSVVDWRNGRRLPLPDAARAVADALDADHLAEMCVKSRTLPCKTCSRQFVQENHGGRARKYCSQKCASTGAARRRRYGAEISPQHFDRLWKERAEASSLAIAAFCRRCEWDGVCKDSACELREESPLPLAKEAAA